MNEQTKNKILDLSRKAGIRQIQDQVPEASLTEILAICNSKPPEPAWSSRQHRSLKKDLMLMKKVHE